MCISISISGGKWFGGVDSYLLSGNGLGCFDDFGFGFVVVAGEEEGEDERWSVLVVPIPSAGYG